MKWTVRAKQRGKGTCPLIGTIVWPHIEADNPFTARDLFIARFGKIIKKRTIFIYSENGR